jgi:hypothetical protein
MAFISIEYKEDLDEYKSVKIKFDSGLIKEFDSGDIIIDWIHMIKFFIDTKEKDPYYTFSSSVDHFLMDNENYSYLFIDQSNDEFKSYNTDDFINLNFNEIEEIENKCIKYIVSYDIKNYVELKKYYDEN